MEIYVKMRGRGGKRRERKGKRYEKEQNGKIFMITKEKVDTSYFFAVERKYAKCRS